MFSEPPQQMGLMGARAGARWGPQALGRFSHPSPLTPLECLSASRLGSCFWLLSSDWPKVTVMVLSGAWALLHAPPSRPISHDSLQLICMGICIVSLALFHQGSTSHSRTWATQQTEALRDPTWTSWESRPPVPSFSRKHSRIACPHPQGTVQSAHPMGSSTDVQAGWGRGGPGVRSY